VDREIQTLHRGARLIQVIDDLIAKILTDIIAEKQGGHLKTGNTIVHRSKREGLDPALVIARPNIRLQTFFDLTPSVVCHFVPVICLSSQKGGTKPPALAIHSCRQQKPVHAQTPQSGV
jgi:hypothetical protein